MYRQVIKQRMLRVCIIERKAVKYEVWPNIVDLSVETKKLNCEDTTPVQIEGRQDATVRS